MPLTFSAISRCGRAQPYRLWAKLSLIDLAIVVFVVALAVGCGGNAGARSASKKVLGMDGTDPQLLQRFMDEGKLPHFQRLAEQGTCATVYRASANFPPVESQARTFSGMGTPDILGTYRTFSPYTQGIAEGTKTLSEEKPSRKIK